MNPVDGGDEFMNAQNQKTIFITDSSSGPGWATAKLFATKGWRVIATMRNPEKETELNKISGIELMAPDITDPKQIKSVAQRVIASGGFDFVFNNAGCGLSGPLESPGDDQINRIVNTNNGAIRLLLR